MENFAKKNFSPHLVLLLIASIQTNFNTLIIFKIKRMNNKFYKNLGL